MSNKLKIYACSGIGATEQQKQFVYFTDGTSTVSNTQAVNTVLAKINSLYIEATMLRGISKEDKIDLLCDVDVYSVALEAAKQYGDDQDKLYRAGQIIDMMIADRLFEYDNLDSSKRDEHLDELIAKFHEYMDDGQPVQGSDASFMSWWEQNILNRNRVGLSKEQQETTKKTLIKEVSKIKGIGKIDPNWQKDPNIGNYLLNAGTYFLYTYLTDAQIAKVPAKNQKVFTYKRSCQRRIYNYCKAYFVGIYGNEAEMKEVIRSGIIREYGNTPEALCQGVENYGEWQNKKIGSITMAVTIGVKEFITILMVCAAVLVAIVKAICDCVYKSNVEKYAALNEGIIEDGNNNSADFDQMFAEATASSTKESTQKTNNMTKIIAVLTGAALLLNN